ncbi:MAG: type II toxin-antitoxin system VapC family toxin [Chloroflexaceae bacterium]|nr:type II toxin-antitoxin system VapC family toxin [Chloroflexaceae bacterium]
MVIQLLRRSKPALAWFNTHQTYGVTAITWMEVMQGTTSKAHQRQASSMLDQFELLYLTAEDQQWAMRQLVALQFSHHISMNDCQIAAVAQRLHLPLYTHNLSDMVPLIGALALTPYT